MVAGPEISWLDKVLELYVKDNPNRESNDSRHGQQKKGSNPCHTNVNSLKNVIEEIGNPFLEDSEVLTIDSKDTADLKVVNTVTIKENLGQEQYDQFVKERLVD